jgi:hypothetical protein
LSALSRSGKGLAAVGRACGRGKVGRWEGMKVIFFKRTMMKMRTFVFCFVSVWLWLPAAVGQQLISKPFFQDVVAATYDSGQYVLVTGANPATGSREMKGLPITSVIAGLTGDETKVQATAPLAVSGVGTTGSPYVLSLTLSGLLDDESDNMLELGPDGDLYLDPATVLAAEAQDLSLSGTTLSLTGDGTSVSLASFLRTIDIGVSVQAYDADLADLADGTLTATKLDAAITRDTEWDTFAEINAASTDTDAVLDTDIGVTVQGYDADLADLADGTLGASKLDSAITRDAEWDTFAELNSALTDATLLRTADFGSSVQAWDADLDDLADGTLSEGKLESSVTRDTEWDTLAEINARSTDTDAVLDTDIGSTVQAFASQVSGGEIAAGSATGLRTYSPANIKAFVDAHASGAGDLSEADINTFAELDAIVADEALVAMSDIDTFAELNVILTDATLLRTADLGSTVQAYDADLADLADGTLSASKLDSAITRDTEWDTMAEINAASTDTDAVLDTDIGVTVQAYDADLADLADGTLGATKIDAAITRDTEWDTFAEINAASTDTDAVLDTDIGNTVQAFAAQVSGGEIAAGTGTSLRTYTPANIKSFIDTHAAGGGGADNLGNHTATQALNLGGFGVTNIGPLTNDDALTSVLVRDGSGNLKYRSAASLSGAGGATSGLLDFEAQGGVEGVGASTVQRQQNWSLLKTLEGQQDTNGLPIFFPAGDWYFQPAVDAADDPNDPWQTDHIEADAGTTILRGAGQSASVLHFPNRNYWYLFRQRAWNASLVIEDLTMTTDGYHSQTFTADASTDKLTAPAHALLGVFQYLKFTSTGTLPAPLAEDLQSSVERVAVVLGDSDSFYVKPWLTGATTFTLDAGANTLNATAHGLANGTLFVPQTTGSLGGTGLTAANRYFVVGTATNTFQLALTSGGAAIDITATGSGTHKGYPVLDITTAGSGTHTFYEIGDRGFFLGGFSTGATSGIDASDGEDEFNTYFRNVRFVGAPPYTGVSSKGAKNVTMLQCDILDVPAVAVNLYVNDTGTEGVDWKRPNMLLDGCRFEMRETLAPPFGNHFLYSHPQPNVRVVNSVFIECRNIAVQFQGESGVAGAGAQIVANSYFNNNFRHFINAQCEDDRSRAIVTGCYFNGTGRLEFRGDVIFSNNFVRGVTSPTLSFTDATTDDTLRKETYLFSNNTFIIAGVNHPNAWASLVRDGEMIVKFSGNIWRRDPGLADDTTFFLGAIGSVTNADTLAEVTFENETYSFDTDGSALGWFLYPAKSYEFIDCRFDGPEAIALTGMASGGTDLRFTDCRFEYEDSFADSQKVAVSIGHSGWTLLGSGNQFSDNSYLDNDANVSGFLEFADRRNPTSITAAATVYVDPSYDTHVVTGTTTISTISIGVTGNVAANAAATNHAKLWTGEVTLIVPSGLTLNSGGNIDNGPYTSSGADAITLVRQASGNWLILE